jgi:hypothetical protein
MHKSRTKWLCVDCSRNTQLEHYFVKDEVWRGLAGMPEHGMLCVNDLEQRIGRPLTPADFTNAHINDPKRNAMTDLLRSRIIGVSYEVQLA